MEDITNIIIDYLIKPVVMKVSFTHQYPVQHSATLLVRASPFETRMGHGTERQFSTKRSATKILSGLRTNLIAVGRRTGPTAS
jgi:hypothetical protein